MAKEKPIPENNRLCLVYEETYLTHVKEKLLLYQLLEQFLMVYFTTIGHEVDAKQMDQLMKSAALTWNEIEKMAAAWGVTSREIVSCLPEYMETLKENELLPLPEDFFESWFEYQLDGKAENAAETEGGPLPVEEDFYSVMRGLFTELADTVKAMETALSQKKAFEETVPGGDTHE